MKTPLALSRPGAFDLGPASREEAVRVNDFIYMSSGTSNSYLVVTPAGDVVINTGMGFEAPRHRRLFRAVSGAPVKFIVLTQGHVDHVGGVDLFREAGTEVVAQRNNRLCQDDDERIAPFRRRRSFVFFPHVIREAIRAAREGLPGTTQARPEPTLLVDDFHSFELGGLRVELFAVPGGETSDSLCVWLPEHRIAFTGNQFGPLFPHFPNFYTIRGDRYRFALPYLESLDRVLSLEPEILITGHFDPIVGRDLIRAELTRLGRAVRYVHDETVRGMNEGKDVFTLMREIRLPGDLEVGEGYGKVSWGVRAIWEGYAGWFQFRSATELYALPPSSVYADIVDLAGGPEPVARRAAERVREGRPLEALHLAEAALAADGGSRAALEAQLGALELLLAGSGGENFWEVSWLRHQIAETRKALDRDG